MNKLIILLITTLLLLTGCTTNTIASIPKDQEVKIGLITDSYEGENNFISQAVDQLSLLESQYNFTSNIFHISDIDGWSDTALDLANEEYDLMI